MKLKLNIATNWNELTDTQLKKIAKIFYASKGKTQDILIFFAIINARFWQLKKIFISVIALKTHTITEFKKHYAFLYETQKRTVFLKQIKTKNKILLPPADRLTNITVDEFAHAEDLFLGWYRTKNIEYLQFLTALLYRENTAAGKRTYFDKNELEKRFKALGKTNENVFLTTAIIYQGCREYLYTRFPVVFPKTEDKQTVPKKSGFGELILEVSGGKFGSFNETKSTNIYTFLADFENKLKKQ